MVSSCRPPSSPSLPVQPVAPLSLAGGALRALLPRELELVDVDSRTLATLVRLRHQLEQHHGWLLLGCIGLALASVAAVGVSFESRLVFGAYAVAVACGTIGLGFVADRVGYGLFCRRARAAGLSDGACQRLFAAAGDAGHWMDVLRSCGHAPSDDEIAGFVRPR
jgi:hypothetical protein